MVIFVAAMCTLYDTHGDVDEDLMILTNLNKYQCIFNEVILKGIQHLRVLLWITPCNSTTYARGDLSLEDKQSRGICGRVCVLC